MKSKIKASIIGCGFIADYYVENLLAAGIQIINSFDVDSKRLDKFSNFYKIKKAKSLDEILMNKEINTIINLVSPEEHFNISRLAILNGKNVYSEKPLTLFFSESIDLYNLAKQNNVHFWSAPSLIFNDFSINFRKNISENFLRENIVGYANFESARLFSLNVSKWRNPSGALWPLKSEIKHGPIIEHSGYLITLLCSILGPVQYIDSNPLHVGDFKKNFEQLPLGRSFKANPNHCTANLYFKNNNIINLIISENTLFRRSIEIHNDENSILISDIRDDFCPIQYLNIKNRGFFAKRVNLFRHIFSRVSQFMPSLIANIFISSNIFSFDSLLKVSKTPFWDWLRRKKPASYHRGILAMKYFEENSNKNYNFEKFFIHTNEVTLYLLEKCDSKKLNSSFCHENLIDDLNQIDKIFENKK